ncbi:MAG: hypothetical protein AVO35_09155 [Candidatus Aegiribacteria sp. MLS_C]|nr:MAG: hypothetical protein AVO35_09155 [Candidatus Aegiribacteria sp. MLS_C]
MTGAAASSLVMVLAILARVPDEVSEFTLSNGIPVITRTLFNKDIEGLSLFIIGGSGVLDEDTQGLEKFALECAMMGSDNYSGPVWRELMDRTQSEWTGSFNYDFSRYHVRCISDDLPDLLNAFGDCLLDPELDPDALEQVRVRTLEELQEKYNDPDSWIWFVANDAFMPGHTYRNLPDGTAESVSGFTADDVRRILDRRIRAGNLLIVHAGPTDPALLARYLEEAFGGIPEGGEPLEPVEPFSLSSDTLVLQPREVETAYAVVKFNAPPQGHPDLLPFRIALAVADDLLWQVLRTENALTYATYAGATSYRENWGYMYVSSPYPARACSLMAGVLRGMIREPVEGDLVRGTVEKQITMMNLGAASREEQCRLIGSSQICTGDWRNAFTDIEDASGLDSCDLSQVLEEWIGPGGWGVIADTILVPAETIGPWPLR